jgi:anti-sigma B factor antagonist
MNIKKNFENGKLMLGLEGRLDTTTAPELEKELENVLLEVKELVFNMSELEYISSAGLRVLLKAQKAMNAQGSMKVTNVNESIMEIFEITGFLDILTIE